MIPFNWVLHLRGCLAEYEMLNISIETCVDFIKLNSNFISNGTRKTIYREMTILSLFLVHLYHRSLLLLKKNR